MVLVLYSFSVHQVQQRRQHLPSTRRRFQALKFRYDSPKKTPQSVTQAQRSRPPSVYRDFHSRPQTKILRNSSVGSIWSVAPSSTRRMRRIARQATLQCSSKVKKMLIVPSRKSRSRRLVDAGSYSTIVMWRTMQNLRPSTWRIRMSDVATPSLKTMSTDV